MVRVVADTAGDVAFVALPIRQRGLLWVPLGGVEAGLGQFDEHQVADDHADEN